MAKPKAKDDPEKGIPNHKEDEEDKEAKIEALKRRAEELSGGQMEIGGLDGVPAEVEEEFWKHVVAYEEAPWTTNLQQLEQAGVQLPTPDSLNDEELTAKLWEVIQKLALLHVFIDQTDHLSDRELYTHLWTDSLREETPAMPLSANYACHLQLLSSGSDEDNLLYLKYYADDDERRHWQENFPGDPIPPHEDRPYHRDQKLPKPVYGQPGDGEPN